MSAPAAAAHVVAEQNVLVPALGETILGLIAFGILVAVLVRVAFPRIEASYAARRDAIEGGMRRAEEEQARARAAYEEYTSQLAEAQKEAARFREEARADATRIRQDANEMAQAEAARVTRAAEERLAAERAGIIRELRVELGGLAVDLAGRIVGHVLESDAEQERVIDSFLTDLESGDVSGTGTGVGHAASSAAPAGPTAGSA